MTESVKVAKTSEIPPNAGRAFDVRGRRIAVFQTAAGTFQAIDDGCTHMGASLAEGTLSNGAVICPWHGAQFSLANGACSGPPARGGVTCFPCRVEGDDVIVDV